MTCPKCSGPLAMLFTSAYCPKCEAEAAEKPRDSTDRLVSITVTGTIAHTCGPGGPLSIFVKCTGPSAQITGNTWAGTPTGWVPFEQMRIVGNTINGWSVALDKSSKCTCIFDYPDFHCPVHGR
jgi:hypothetical protein